MFLRYWYFRSNRMGGEVQIYGKLWRGGDFIFSDAVISVSLCLKRINGSCSSQFVNLTRKIRLKRPPSPLQSRYSFIYFSFKCYSFISFIFICLIHSDFIHFIRLIRSILVRVLQFTIFNTFDIFIISILKNTLYLKWKSLSI